MRKARTYLLGVLALLAVCLLVGFIGYLRMRRVGRQAHPLVLIHSPLNNAQVALGKAGSVHATARSPNGVRRIELWADGVFVEAVNSPEEGATSLLVLNTSWEARTLGRHTMLVRAISVEGIEGQATVFVEAVEGEGELAQRTVGEQETLEQIAADHGLSPQELVDLNPGLDPESLDEGDLINVPGGNGPSPHVPNGSGDGFSRDPEESPEAEALPADEQPPNPFGDAPNSSRVGYSLPFDLAGASIPGLEELTQLRVEVFALETGAAFESLHCYASLGGRSPRWYPDSDGDQGTDEYFTSSDGLSWDVEAYMADHLAPAIYWPGNQSLNFTVVCVGIRGGGTDSTDLGPMSLSIPPTMWDGAIRTARTELGEGGFSVNYRVSQEALVPKGPDRDMARPINLWINYGGGYLTWDYSSGEEEEPSGFIVFLNDTLVWEESSDAHRSALPGPWLYPPCGEEYVFTVVAFFSPYPAGRHSVPREPWEEDYEGDQVAISGGEPGSAECTRRVTITYESLTTGEIPEDPVPNNWAHASGPIHGNFYVMDHNKFFEYWQFVPNLEYSANTLLASEGLTATFPVHFREGEEGDFWFGFSIRDEDEGGYETLCQGSVILTYSWLERLGFHEGTIESHEDGGSRCNVKYTITPDEDSPGGTGSVLPLPHLHIEDFSVEPSSGQLRIHVRNIGSAPWSLHDLDIRVTTQSGELIGDYTWIGERVGIGVGDTIILQTRELTPDPPFDICVTLDPENKVLDAADASGDPRPVCPAVPDLLIREVQYDPAGDRLMVTVANHGDDFGPTGAGHLENRDVLLRLIFADGSQLERQFDDVSIELSNEIQFEWPELGDEQRDRMLGGYAVIVDPENDIAEVDEDNNEYHVRASAALSVTWRGAHLYAIPLRNSDTCYTWRSQDQIVTVKVYVQSDYESHLLAEWSIEQEMTDWVHNLEFSVGTYLSAFRIAGDQSLTIEIIGEVNSDGMGSDRFSYGAEDDWRPPFEDGEGINFYVNYPSASWDCHGPWSVELGILLTP